MKFCQRGREEKPVRREAEPVDGTDQRYVSAYLVGRTRKRNLRKAILKTSVKSK